VVSFTGAEVDVAWVAKGHELAVTETNRPPGRWGDVWGDLDHKIRQSPKDGRVILHILLDIASIEVVSGVGENYIIQARTYWKLGKCSPLVIRAEGGDVKFIRLEVYPLKSIHTQETVP
jgi:hypothetical protein